MAVMSQAERPRFLGAAALAAALLVPIAVGCGGGSAGTPTVADVDETVVIGGLPGPLSVEPTPTLPSTTVAESTTTTEPAPSPITGPIVDEVLGYRVLLVGDTALSVTTPRAEGIMCDVVTGFGWTVEIEAEPGRSIDFAQAVLDELLDPVGGEDWDVVGLMFGHHIGNTPADFERILDDVLDRLDRRPVILYTVAELGDQQVEVNRIIRERRRSRPNVVIVDWAEAAAGEPDVLLDDGGPFPSDEGAGRLALFTAAALSRTPGDEPGECLPSVFTDDSAIVL